MKKDLDARDRELGEIKPIYQKYREDNTRLSHTGLAVLGLGDGLQLLRQKVYLDNEQQRAAKLAELRDTMGCKGGLSSVSMLEVGDSGDGHLS